MDTVLWTDVRNVMGKFRVLFCYAWLSGAIVDVQVIGSQVCTVVYCAPVWTDSC